MNYIRRLKELRNDKGLTQAQVSESLHIDQCVYSTYETGKREIPLQFFIILTQFYGVSLDYLAGFTDEP